MLSTEVSRQALRRLFQRDRVADLETVQKSLQTQSRMSAFRRLKEVGYLSSFTHNGRNYTLLDIPDFDENGIWFHRGIGFSAKGTLKDTVAELVSASDAGRTHSELEGLVRARVHNALLALTREERVGREHLGRMYLYVNADPGVASEQVRRRQEWLESRSEAEIPLSDTLTIEVLVEALHMSEARVAPEDVAERLRARGVSIRPEQVREVFARYGMDPEKKTAPPSKPSPR